MKKWYWIGFLIVLVLWLVGSWWILLPSTERALAEAATKALSDPANRQAFSDVKVRFSGQEAVLTGQVASAADKTAAGELILTQVKLPGSGLNPVLGLRNAIEISTDYAAKHPRPWLMALVMPGSATITGVLPTAADREAAAKALAAKLGPAGAKLDNQIKTAPEAGDVRAAVDLPGTLASNDLSSLPGKALAEEKFKAAMAVSACDGHWTLLSSSTDDTGVVAALGNTLPDPSLVNAAYAPLLAIKVEQNEKDRLSRLPPASIALLVVSDKLQPGGSVQVTGSVADQVSKNALMQALHKRYERYAVKDNTTLSGAVRPGGDWAKGLSAAPHPGKDLNAIKLDLPGTSHILVPGTDPAIFALGTPEGKPVVWDGKVASNEFAKTLSDSDFGKALSVVGLTAPPVQPLFDAIEDLKRAKKAEAEARASAEAAAAASKKAAADAAAKAKADAEAAMAKARAADADAKAKAQQTKLPAPGYLGWAVAGTTVRLFGVAGSAEQKDTALKAAAAAFPGLTVGAAGIAIDAARVLPGVKFPSGLDPKKPGIGILSGGTESQTFDADVYDSEIVKAMPFAGFSSEDLAKSLEPYRADLVKAGTLKQDDAYVSISSDGKVVTLSGELADAAARSKVVEAVKAGAAGLAVDDKGLQVTPLVKADADLSATLSSLPKFEPGKAQIATLRPGQKMRAGVVHGIYFATGSDRSKDQERALYQVRRLLSINPAAKFEIVGSTDNVGSPDANIKLSQERAQKFAAYLEAAGVPKDRLSARGAGPNEPIADNASEAGRAMNRRVDVLLK